eukprot:6197443-Pleurochrysis_carterae.AAC.1
MMINELMIRCILPPRPRDPALIVGSVRPKFCAGFDFDTDRIHNGSLVKIFVLRYFRFSADISCGQSVHFLTTSSGRRTLPIPYM